MNEGQKYVQEICHENLQKMALFRRFLQHIFHYHILTMYRQCEGEIYRGITPKQLFTEQALFPEIVQDKL